MLTSGWLSNISMRNTNLSFVVAFISSDGSVYSSVKRAVSFMESACPVNAANGEKDEWGTLYPAFADDAEAEGFNDIAATFRAIVDAEMAHEKRYRILAEAVKNGTVFKRPEKVYWRCGDCGYTCFAEEPPERCPVCNNPRRVFRIADIDN